MTRAEGFVLTVSYSKEGVYFHTLAASRGDVSQIEKHSLLASVALQGRCLCTLPDEHVTHCNKLELHALRRRRDSAQSCPAC